MGQTKDQFEYDGSTYKRIENNRGIIQHHKDGKFISEGEYYQAKEDSQPDPEPLEPTGVPIGDTFAPTWEFRDVTAELPTDKLKRGHEWWLPENGVPIDIYDERSAIGMLNDKMDEIATDLYDGFQWGVRYTVFGEGNFDDTSRRVTKIQAPNRRVQLEENFFSIIAQLRQLMVDYDEVIVEHTIIVGREYE